MTEHEINVILSLYYKYENISRHTAMHTTTEFQENDYSA